MVNEDAERVLWIWTLSELVVITVLFLLLATSSFGKSSFLASVSRPIRLAALAFLAAELFIPLFVYLDLRRRPGSSDTI